MSMFKGGVHPPEHKELTQHLAIEQVPLAPLYVVPLSQHIGAPGDETQGFLPFYIGIPYLGSVHILPRPLSQFQPVAGQQAHRVIPFLDNFVRLSDLKYQGQVKRVWYLHPN